MNNPGLGDAPIYQEVVRTRALVAEEMAQRAAGLNRSHDPAVATLEDELEKRRRKVMDLQAGTINGKENDLRDAIEQMEQIEGCLLYTSRCV